MGLMKKGLIKKMVKQLSKLEKDTLDQLKLTPCLAMLEKLKKFLNGNQELLLIK